MTDRRRFALAGLLLVAAVAITFGGALDNEFVNWDDGNYIVINPLVTDPGRHGVIERLTTPSIGYSVPLPMLLYGWLWAWTEAPWAFHLLSLLVHGANALLLLWLLWRQTSRLRVAWVGAVAFALHPVVVEPVAWATGLKDLLVGTGCLLALVWLGRGPLSLIGVLVALASKPSAALIGAWLLAVRWVEDGLARAGPRRVLITVALATAAGLALLAYTAAQEGEQLRTSAAGGDMVRRVLGAVGLHVEHLLVPASLSPRYPLASVSIAQIVVGGIVIALVLWLAWSWGKRRDARFGWLALGFATYLPASNLRPLIRFTADSYIYVPWIAAAACGALSYLEHEDRLRALGRRSFGALRALVTLALPGWAVISHLEVETWADTTSLWAHAAMRYPEDGELIYRYGDALGRDGQREAELELYLEHLDALAGSPKIPAALTTWYAFRGELDEADRWYALAFASEVRQDDSVYWHYVDYVARNPGRHPPSQDVALGHALGVYVESLSESELDAPQLELLVAHAVRLGRPDVAERIRVRASDVIKSE